MILTMNYSDLKAPAIRGEIDSKKVDFFMWITVNEENISEALEKVKNNPNVIALNYTGGIDFLHNNLTLPEGFSKPIIINQKIEDIDINFDFIMNTIDSKFRVVAELPPTYNDMRKVHTLCSKYPNVRVTGGRFIRLLGCRIGSIAREDIPKKIADSRIPLITEGEGSAMPVIDINNVSLIEYHEGKLPKGKKQGKKAPSKGKAKTKKKKQLSSLLDLVDDTGLDNF